MKKTIKPKLKKVTKKKDDLIFVAGLITKGKDKGKYIAMQVRNSMMLNPVEPIFETNPGMEYVVVGKNEEIVKKIFGRIVALANQDNLIEVKDE